MPNLYQQLKQEIFSVLREPVARVSHARTARHRLQWLVRGPRRWRPVPVLLALTQTHVVVFSADDASASLTAPSCEHVVLAQVQAVGRRWIRATDDRGGVHWFRLGTEEPSARGFLTPPRTYRAP